MVPRTAQKDKKALGKISGRGRSAFAWLRAGMEMRGATLAPRRLHLILLSIHKNQKNCRTFRWIIILSFGFIFTSIAPILYIRRRVGL